MARKDRKSAQRAGEREEQAFDEGKARLDELVRQLVDTESDIKEQLYQLVENYKSVCRRTVERRSQIIQDVSVKNVAAGQYLENDRQFHVSIPERTMWVHKGVFFTYMPNEEEAAPDEPGEGKSLNLVEDGDEMVLDPPEPSKPESAEASTNNPVPHSEQYQKQRSPKPAPLERGSTSPTFNGRTRKKQVPPHFSSRNCNWTGEPSLTVKATNNYWVFDYQSPEGLFLFVLRCPSPNCQNPIFSHHPLKQKRAVKHLKECGVPFSSEKDIVKRYARQVKSGRKDREITYSWAHKHNINLLGANERHLEEESI